MNSPIDQIIALALAEDVGLGDRTSEALIDDEVEGTAVMLAKSAGILCGLDVAEKVFSEVDSSLQFEPALSDGAELQGEREEIARIRGSLKSILIAERTALNFLQRMSGVATLTSQFVAAVDGTNAQIVDTRKTMPGMRLLDKYAVGIGGAKNHRFNLSDGVLIKDNHIAAVGGVQQAVELARNNAPHTLRVEIECKTLRQVAEALAARADIILLDNMSVDTLRKAVRIIDNRALTEASGGVNLEMVRAIAETGVDLISVGALTHSAVALDISLDIEVASTSTE